MLFQSSNHAVSLKQGPTRCILCIITALCICFCDVVYLTATCRSIESVLLVTRTMKTRRVQIQTYPRLLTHSLINGVLSAHGSTSITMAATICRNRISANHNTLPHLHYRSLSTRNTIHTSTRMGNHRRKDPTRGESVSCSDKIE